MLGNLGWVPSMGRLLDGVDCRDAIESCLGQRAVARARERESFEGLTRRVAEFLRMGGGGAPAIDLVTRAELAHLLGCSERTLQRMEASGKITRTSGFSRLVRFNRDAVLRQITESIGAAS